MSATEGIFWAALVWSVFFLYSLFDVPTLVSARVAEGKSSRPAADATPLDARCTVCRRTFEDCTCGGDA